MPVLTKKNMYKIFKIIKMKCNDCENIVDTLCLIEKKGKVLEQLDNMCPIHNVGIDLDEFMKQEPQYQQDFQMLIDMS